MRHPRALWVLVSVEALERFGYYLMMAILALFLTGALGYSDGAAGALVGSFMAWVYLLSLAGGWLADRLIGRRRAVLSGLLSEALGYLLLADAACTPEEVLWKPLLYMGLVLLALGGGLFKPAMPALLGGLYTPADLRRERAFSIFYMFVNIGALLSPLAAALLRHAIGWGAAFLGAGLGAAAGGLVLTCLGRTVEMGVVPALPEDRTHGASARERTVALVVLSVILVAFWAIFQQNATTLVYWARDNTDLTLGGLLSAPMDPELFASVNPLFIIALTPLCVWGWKALGRRGLESTTPAKMTVGMGFCALSCGLLALGAIWGGDVGRVSALWLCGAYLLATLAELCLSPMGLSLVSRLAPRRQVGLLIGVWYASTALGNKLAGDASYLWQRLPHSTFFLLLMAASTAATLLLWGLQGWLDRVMGAPRSAASRLSPVYDYDVPGRHIIARGRV